MGTTYIYGNVLVIHSESIERVGKGDHTNHVDYKYNLEFFQKSLFNSFL